MSAAAALVAALSSFMHGLYVMRNQLTRGLPRRVMYVENKDGDVDGVAARIGWVEFSKTGKTVYYRGREFASIGGSGVRGNFLDVATREEYWISGVKRRGSNTHRAEKVAVEIDPDALDAYRALRSGK
ncbi:hypothetical protein OVA11_06245 [Caulobacter sp. SL161]|uniref:hypothetical protein n=1 Tax=Caulobacter sp. SL161 TaxID=2995156 RepID=UPI002273F245|nr:hypothetical protein [Caulobacter sp. SL161]MCY1646687.1 hypothetical protein [Caulobacter sp. SL161]